MEDSVLTGPIASGPAPATVAPHLTNLPEAEQAKNMLHRVVREFEPILKRRGYNVRSISEMCCCGDGLDATGRHKRRIMGPNVWGYNQSTTRGRQKLHTIHLRLRHPRQHARFLAYHDVAGTLAHELAHCEHGPHNDKFYKLMDEILEEHATLITTGMANGRSGTVAFGGSGQRLGGNVSMTGTRQASAGRRLGGDSCFTQWMTPAEAAVVAAEARRRQQLMRRRGNSCCQPLMIDIDDDENEYVTVGSSTSFPLATISNQTSDGGSKRALPDGDTKPPAKKKASQVIDLTDDPCPPRSWSCRACTFWNEASTLEHCSMCHTEWVLR